MKISSESYEKRLAETACGIAKKAGFLLKKRHLARGVKRFGIETKGSAIDLVTDVDRKLDKLITSAIKRLYPDHGIVSEESDSRSSKNGYVWYVDPIDGTTNFVHGYPFFSVSIGIERQGELVAGCVYDPVRDEMFSARKGKGARLNKRRITVSSAATLNESLLASGFPYDVKTSAGNNIDLWNRFLMEARALRRDGSAALDLCYVAAGRFDGFWEMKLKPWDLAAGLLIVSEAGGRISDFTDGQVGVFSGEVLADNGRIHAQMLKILSTSVAGSKKGSK